MFLLVNVLLVKLHIDMGLEAVLPGQQNALYVMLCYVKSAIIIQCYHPYLSDFCSRPQLTQPYNHIIYPGVAKI